MKKKCNIKFQCYQYISAFIEPVVLLRYMNSTIMHSNIVLDLEDSVWDINDEENTKNIKKIARKNLTSLFTKSPELKIGLRINSIHSEEFINDLEFLNNLRDIKWDVLVFPKIESTNDLILYFEALKEINFREAIICIESTNGIKNLIKILEENTFNKMSKVQFGHFDYFLDANIFPIPNQTEIAFWEVCEKLIETVESQGYSYLHTPLKSLKNQNLMHSVIGKLQFLCSNNFGLATITKEQSIQLFNYSEGEYRPLSIIKSNYDKTAYAKDIIYQFTRIKNKSFSFYNNSQKGRFIPPQEYLGAINFLSMQKNDLNIGFVGGCAITQHDIPKKNKFFEVFKSKMKSDSLKEVSISFSSYSQFYQLEKSCDKIFKKQKMDVLTIHIRPQPFLFLSKFILRKLNKKNRATYLLNQILFMSTIDQCKDNYAPPVFNQLATKPRLKERNIRVGNIFRFNIKASKLIFKLILNIQSKCKQNDIQLVILGIPPQPMTKLGNLNCKKFNKYLIKKCKDNRIVYIDSYAKMNNDVVFQKDKLHLSEEGHYVLGEILYNKIKKLIKK